MMWNLGNGQSERVFCGARTRPEREVMWLTNAYNRVVSTKLSKMRQLKHHFCRIHFINGSEAQSSPTGYHVHTRGQWTARKKPWQKGIKHLERCMSTEHGPQR